MNKEPYPPPTMVYATGRDEKEAMANLIRAHDPTGGTKIEGFETAGIKKYAEGKAYAWADGLAAHAGALRGALTMSIQTTVFVNAERFRYELRRRARRCALETVDAAPRGPRLRGRSLFGAAKARRSAPSGPGANRSRIGYDRSRNGK
jgi:hypothetical protein